jgi:hypothetical protein
MDPDSGRLYPSLEAARADGVANPVEIRGELEDLQRISEVLQAEQARSFRKRLRKAEKKSRRKNRGQNS